MCKLWKHWQRISSWAVARRWQQPEKWMQLPRPWRNTWVKGRIPAEIVGRWVLTGGSTGTAFSCVLSTEGACTDDCSDVGKGVPIQMVTWYACIGWLRVGKEKLPFNRFVDTLLFIFLRPKARYTILVSCMFVLPFVQHVYGISVIYIILWQYGILAYISQLTNKWSDSSDMFAHRDQLKSTVQEILFDHYQDTWLQLKKQVFSFCQNNGRHFWRCRYISYMATMAYYTTSERTYRILSRITVLTSCTRVMTYPFGRSLVKPHGNRIRNLDETTNLGMITTRTSICSCINWHERFRPHGSYGG